MRKISLWARSNRWITRLSIIILHVFISGLGLFAGKNLYDLGFEVSGFLLVMALLLFMSGVLYYPDKKRKASYEGKSGFYARQKICDWMLAFSTFTIMCFTSNARNSPFIFSQVLKGSAMTASTMTPVPSDNGKKQAINLHPTKAERKAIFKELKKVLKESLRKEKGSGNQNATRILLVVLSIIGAVGLCILLAALACNISCNGSETLAMLVLLLGAAAITGLLIVTIKAIIKAYPRTRREYPPIEAIQGKSP